MTVAQIIVPGFESNLSKFEFFPLRGYLPFGGLFEQDELNDENKVLDLNSMNIFKKNDIFI